jgi:hypothetical protein
VRAPRDWFEPELGVMLTIHYSSGPRPLVTGRVSGRADPEVESIAYGSPSDAASSITSRRTNGWTFFLTDPRSERTLSEVRREYIEAMVVDANEEDLDEDGEEIGG